MEPRYLFLSRATCDIRKQINKRLTSKKKSLYTFQHAALQIAHHLLLLLVRSLHLVKDGLILQHKFLELSQITQAPFCLNTKVAYVARAAGHSAGFSQRLSQLLAMQRQLLKCNVIKKSDIRFKWVNEVK